MNDRVPGRVATKLVAAALGLVVVGGAFGALLVPGTAAASRDIPSFHLPLRTALMDLAQRGGGLPTWNPWIHGGQPILSNPNYAAFYPPTWMAVFVGPTYGLGLLLVFHAALAFTGAWLLARRLGCEPAAAALAATGFAGGGAFLGLTASFNLLCSLAWWPWVLVATIRILNAPRDEGLRGWLPAAAGGGAALAATLLAGDPTGSLIAGCGVLAVAVSALGRSGKVSRSRRIGRLAALGVLGLTLGAIQWLPTWQRLADSPRAEALPLEVATRWSAPPLRLAELAFPRMWGDPARINEGRFYGWRLHDRGYPYIVSIYPGLLVLLLALASLARGPLPLRATWLTALGLGFFLALGRHNPLFPLLHEHLPLLGRTRYPEKFLLLVTSALPFVAALGWQRVLDERRRGRVASADLPLALGLAVAAALGLLAAALHLGAIPLDDFLRAGSPLPPTDRGLAEGRAYLVRETWIALAFALAGVGVLAVARWRRIPSTVLAVLVVGVLGGDLWYYGHGLVHTVPTETYRRPPEIVAEIPPGNPSARRIFRLPGDRNGLPEILFRPAEPFRYHVRHGLDKLDPLSGLLWGIGHIFPPDYDLMLTERALRNRELFGRGWETTDRGLRILGAWGVGHLVTPRTLEERADAFLEGREMLPAVLGSHPYLLPPFRFVPEVYVHPTEAAALEAAKLRGFDVHRREHWVRIGDAAREAAGDAAAPEAWPRTPKPELLSVEELGGEIELHYRAPAESYLVAAVTWDRGWRARVREGEGADLPLYLTALGQVGCAVPAGEHRVLLTYREPWVPVGAAVTGGAAFLLMLLLGLTRILGTFSRSRGSRSG